MAHFVETLITLAAICGLLVLGLRRLDTCIKSVAVQGAAIAALPLLLHEESLPAHGTVIALAAASIAVKGVLVPLLMLRAMREAGVTKEVDPYVGHLPSVGFGIVAIGVALWVAPRLPLRIAPELGLVLPIAIATIVTGLFVLVTRRNALSQVLGFLVLENGVFAFGLTLLRELPVLVELGVLLDVFVAVFAMGIATFRIKQTFDHVETDKLDELKG